jgi:hypothetical protein
MASRNDGNPALIGMGNFLNPAATQPAPGATHDATPNDPTEAMLATYAANPALLATNPAIAAFVTAENLRRAQEEARRAAEAASEAGRRPLPPPPPPGGYVPPPAGRPASVPPPPGGRPGYPPPGIGWPGPDVPVGTIERRQPYTQLAQRAIATLRAASREALVEATERARAKQIPADRLMDWIERKTRIGEVLGGAASGWSSDTAADFAQAFQMQQGNVAVMDVLAALALLNWPDLEGEVREENTTAPTGTDLLQNRRVIYQYPAPGTPLEPPYVVLVAVEHQDTRRAEEMVGSIMGSLVASSGFRMPREAAAKLG